MTDASTSISTDSDSSDDTTIQVDGQRDPCGRVIIGAFTALVVGAILCAEPLQSANDRSRWSTVWSLVERGTYQIDEIQNVPGWNTIDKVRHRNKEQEPWHFYSSKPPMLATGIAVLYWFEKHTLGYTLTDSPEVTIPILLILVNALPMALALLSLRSSLQLLDVTRQTQWLLLLVAGFASMLTPFLTTLNNHTPAAVCVIFCLSAMIRIRCAKEVRGPDFLITGVTAALTCCFELPAALFGIMTFAFVLWHNQRLTLRWYVPAAALPLAFFFLTNWLCTGGVKPFYAYYGTDKYVYVHEGVPSYWSNPRDLDANSETTAVYAFHCLFGHHGVFSLTPVLLLTLAGFFISRAGPFPQIVRPFMWMASTLSVAIFAFYLARTQNYNYGGNTAALRWVLWLTPFWWLAMVPVLERLTARRAGLAIVAILMAASCFSVFYSIRTPWKANWIFTRLERSGAIAYRTKNAPFDPPRYTLIRSVPDAIGSTFTWVGSGDAAGETLTIYTVARANVDGEVGTLVTVSHKDALTEQSASVVILTDRITESGNRNPWAAVPASVIPDSGHGNGTTVKIAGNQLAPAPGWVVQKLRGLPAVRPYNAESSRYLRYRNVAGRMTAIPCERGAARVVVVDPKHGSCAYRCDVMFNPDVPFGVAQWKVTVTSESSGDILRQEHWTTQHFPHHHGD